MFPENAAAELRAAAGLLRESAERLMSVAGHSTRVDIATALVTIAESFDAMAITLESLAQEES
jgi:hypothetical protein